VIGPGSRLGSSSGLRPLQASAWSTPAKFARCRDRAPRSLIAVVHGHCSYVVSGTFALLEESDPVGSALARVRECLAAQN
jgi:hypothetical protein